MLETSEMIHWIWSKEDLNMGNCGNLKMMIEEVVEQIVELVDEGLLILAL